MGFNLADLFEAVADAVPDHEALVCAAGPDGPEVRLTYRQLDERATRLAHVLAGRGVAVGDRVGIHLANGNEYLEVMLACFKLQAVPVNVNYRYIEDELRHVFRDSGARLVVHEPDLADVVAAAGPGIDRLARGGEYEAALAGASPERAFGPRSGDDRYVLYTGGTTGLPRGVVWRHEDLFFAALGGREPGGVPVRDADELRRRSRRRGARCLAACPFMHGTGHWMALSTLYAAGTVIVNRHRGLVPDAVWDQVAAEQVSFLVIVGDAYARPLVDALAEEPERWRLDSLTVVLSGGAVLSPALKTALLQHLPSAIVVDGFGASETGGQGRMVAVPGEEVPLGRFTVGPDSAVLDDDLRPLPPGDPRVGWLARRGHIPIGYLGDPAASARTFPVVDGVRWAVPGDRASIAADGTITVYGRGSATITSGGEKIHPEEVEACLKAHPDVFDAVVVGTPDERWGEVVTAVVQPRRGRAPTLGDLTEHCRASIAGFKVPRRLVLVGEVARGATGKADYRWARSAAAAG